MVGGGQIGEANVSFPTFITAPRQKPWKLTCGSLVLLMSKAKKKEKIKGNAANVFPPNNPVLSARFLIIRS